MKGEEKEKEKEDTGRVRQEDCKFKLSVGNMVT